MSDFYIIHAMTLSNEHAFTIRDKLSDESICLLLSDRSKHKLSLSPPFMTFDVDDDSIREWAMALNRFVRYIDDRKLMAPLMSRLK